MPSGLRCLLPTSGLARPCPQVARPAPARKWLSPPHDGWPGPPCDGWLGAPPAHIAPQVRPHNSKWRIIRPHQIDRLSRRPAPIQTANFKNFVYVIRYILNCDSCGLLPPGMAPRPEFPRSGRRLRPGRLVGGDARALGRRDRLPGLKGHRASPAPPCRADIARSPRLGARGPHRFYSLGDARALTDSLIFSSRFV